MSTQFYSRATGKLSKASHGSLSEIKRSNRDGSSIYSIDDADDSLQYPFEGLSSTQIKYITQFVRSLAGDETLEIDPYTRGIHWIGMWKADADSVTVSCSFLQPHITNCVISPRGVSYATAKKHCQEFFINANKAYPSISQTNTSFQVLGKYSIPFIDSMIQNHLIQERNINWSNVVIGQTQPVFVVISPKGGYECSLTYNSCLVLDEASPAGVNISHPVSGTLNFSFRSSNVSDRDGEGGHMTLHGSGVIQSQGSPKYIGETMACFRMCIMSAMQPRHALRFISSLNVIREI